MAIDQVLDLGEVVRVRMAEIVEFPSAFVFFRPGCHIAGCIIIYGVCFVLSYGVIKRDKKSFFIIQETTLIRRLST